MGQILWDKFYDVSLDEWARGIASAIATALQQEYRFVDRQWWLFSLGKARRPLTRNEIEEAVERGDRNLKEGDRCPAVVTYDRMDGSTYCRRVLQGPEGMQLKDARRRAIALARTMEEGVITIYRLRSRQFTFQKGHGPEGNDTVMVVHVKWAKDGYYDKYHSEWLG